MAGLALVAKSHAVMENFSPRVMRQFGLDYAVLREGNPANVSRQALPELGRS